MSCLDLRRTLLAEPLMQLGPRVVFYPRMLAGRRVAQRPVHPRFRWPPPAGATAEVSAPRVVASCVRARSVAAAHAITRLFGCSDRQS